jgi:integrase
MEATVDAGLYEPPEATSISTVADLLRKYLTQVTAKKKGRISEAYRLQATIRSPLGEISVSEVRPHHIAEHKERRLLSVAQPSVRRELVILRHAFEVARREWSCRMTANPVAEVRMPSNSAPRVRRLTEAEYSRLLSGAEARQWWLRPLIVIAVETAMRRGEILNARWEDLNKASSTLRIPNTKTGVERTIPLTLQALEAIASLPASADYIFPMSANAARLAWERLKARQSIYDLRFHDLRHEAISRFFERGLSIAEVALISGHKDPRMLFRYTHLRAEDVAKKLQNRVPCLRVQTPRGLVKPRFQK